MEWYCWALCGLMAICFVALLAMCVAGGRADRARDEVERLRSAERAAKMKATKAAEEATR